MSDDVNSAFRFHDLSTDEFYGDLEVTDFLGENAISTKL